MARRVSTLKVAVAAAVLGVVAPILWTGLVRCCYQPQLPLTSEGPLPPRFVDHVVNVTFAVWLSAVLFLPPIVPSPPPSAACFYLMVAGLLAANAAIYAGIACAVYLAWRRLRRSR